MDKSELRRTQLIALVKALGHGGIALVASKIGKEPSYVSRMLYEPNKAGKKRVTENSADLLDNAFPNWITDPEQAAIRVKKVADFSAVTLSQSKTNAIAAQTSSTADALTGLAAIVEALHPNVQLAGRDVLRRWSTGDMDTQSAAATLDAFTHVSDNMKLGDAARTSATPQARQTQVPQGIQALLADKHNKPTLDEDPEIKPPP